MSAQTKEQIHDEQISPLVLQIMEICKANKIGCLLTFHTPNEAAPRLFCTSAHIDSGEIGSDAARSLAAGLAALRGDMAELLRALRG